MNRVERYEILLVRQIEKKTNVYIYIMQHAEVGCNSAQSTLHTVGCNNALSNLIFFHLYIVWPSLLKIRQWLASGFDLHLLR